MAHKSRRITMTLTKGNPDCIRTASFKRGDILAVAFRRDELSEVKKELKNIITRPGVYVLIGKNPDNPKRPIAYVGEGKEVSKRLTAHDKGKPDSWTDAAVLVSNLGDPLTVSETRNLEGLLVNKIKLLRQWDVDNSRSPSDNPGGLSKHDNDDLERSLGDAIVMLDALGINVFRDIASFEKKKVPRPEEPVNRGSNKSDRSNETNPVADQRNSRERVHRSSTDVVFEAKGNDYQAYATIDADGQVTLLKNSKISRKTNNYMKDHEKRIKQLIDSEQVVKNEKSLELRDNITLKSPSAAAVFVSLSSRSGPIFWKTMDNKLGRLISLKDYRELYGVSIDEPIFKFKSSKFAATMRIKSGKRCVVYRGSKASLSLSPRARPHIVRQRTKLIKDNTLSSDGNYFVFSRDCEFPSPSTAGGVIVGHDTNGKISWVLPDGTTYGEWADRQ